MAEELKVSEVIGQGAFGMVYRGSYKNHKICAIKKIKITKNSKQMLKRIDQEFNILLNIKHKSIISVFAVVRSPESYNIVMEYLDGKDIEKIIKSSRFIEIHLAKKWLGDLIQALAYLRDLKVVHRDIKPSNLLLSTQNIEKSDIKLIDFGFATNFNDMMLNSRVGTPLYMAPEILNGKSYNYKADVWSLGVAAFEMVYGKPPFNAKSMKELIELQMKPINYYDHPNVSAEMKDVINCMIQEDPSRRLDYDDLLKLPFFQSDNKLSISGVNLKSSTEVQLGSDDESEKFRKDFNSSDQISYILKGADMEESKKKKKFEEGKEFKQPKDYQNKKESKVIKDLEKPAKLNPKNSSISERIKESSISQSKQSQKILKTYQRSKSNESLKKNEKVSNHTEASIHFDPYSQSTNPKLIQKASALEKIETNKNLEDSVHLKSQSIKKSENQEIKVICISHYTEYYVLNIKSNKLIEKGSNLIGCWKLSKEYLKSKSWLFKCLSSFLNDKLKKITDKLEVLKFYENEIINQSINQFISDASEPLSSIKDSILSFQNERSQQELELEKSIEEDFKKYLNEPSTFSSSKKIHKILIESIESINPTSESLLILIQRFNFFYRFNDPNKSKPFSLK